MPDPVHIPQISKRSARGTNSSSGFALIIALVLMAFTLLILVVLNLTLRIKTQESVSARDMKIAKENALLGLVVGIGEVQRLSGPDTRVTARAEITNTALTSPFRFWTGVWDSADEDPTAAAKDHTLRKAYDNESRSEAMGWLASIPADMDPQSVDPATLTIPSADSITLVSGDGTSTQPPVVAAKVDVPLSSGEGSYAWWAGDEGVKARIDTKDEIRDGTIGNNDWVGPTFTFGTVDEKVISLSSSIAQRTGIEKIGSPWDDLSDDELASFENAYTYESIRSALDTMSPAEESEFVKNRQDLTVLSRGLLTDVRKGGLKKDLTIAFEDDQIFGSYFGVEPIDIGFDEDDDRQNHKLHVGVKKFPIDDQPEHPSDFYLTPEIQAVNKLNDVGPTWGSLYSYYNLYKIDGIATDGEMSPITRYPKGGIPNHVPNSLPYKNFWKDNNPDTQHTNSPVSPIVERFQLHIRVGAVEVIEDGVPHYKLRFYLQPLLGLWNPYNIKIKRTYSDIDQNDFYPQYRFSFEAAPELEISGEFEDGTTFSETVNVANAYMKGEGNNIYTQGVWAALAPEDLDFMPGEIRLMSAKAKATGNFRENQLDYGWQDSEGFYFDWPFPHSPDSYKDKYVADKPVTVHSVKIKERNDDWFAGGSRGDSLSGAYWGLSHETPSDINKNNSNYGLQSSSGFWKDPVYADKHSELDLYPGTLPDGTIPPFIPSERLNFNYIDIGTWLFHLRSTNEPNNGLRNLIDANPRAIYAAPRWDGTALLAQGAYQAGGDDQDGYLAAGSVPEPSLGDYSRNTGINGPSISDSSLGQSHMILFDIPRAPLLSLGQLQHANLGRYSFEPSYLVGNSYANQRIPLDTIKIGSFGGARGLNLFDTAYMVNDKIFDEFFFSTVSPDLTDAEFQDLLSKEKRPYNTRNQFVAPAEASRSDLFSFESPSVLDAWGSRFAVDGAFNINSTSVDAWKAIFSSMDQPFLRIDVSGTDADAVALTDPDGVYVSRTSLPLFEEGYTANASGRDSLNGFFNGYRKLSDEELDALAEAMVEEVKERGPFLSMSDFVNRRLQDADPENQRRGALQAALDSTVNQNISSDLSSDAVNLSGTLYSEAISSSLNDTQAIGYNGYVLQGDLLQTLAPILTPRSDTFVVRSYGASGSSESGTGEMWCEAVLQRVPDRVGTGNSLTAESLQELAATNENLSNVLNQKFGRKYQIVGFRWLSREDL